MYFLAKNKITSISGYPKFFKIIGDDYAIIDGHLVIKRNSDFQITLIFNKSNADISYSNIFESLIDNIRRESLDPFWGKEEIINKLIPQSKRAVKI